MNDRISSLRGFASALRDALSSIPMGYRGASDDRNLFGTPVELVIQELEKVTEARVSSPPYIPRPGINEEVITLIQWRALASDKHGEELLSHIYVQLVANPPQAILPPQLQTALNDFNAMNYTQRWTHIETALPRELESRLGEDANED